MNDFTLVGFWKFKSNRVRQEDGTWMTEALVVGSMAFSASGQALLLVRSEQGAWGYSGTYSLRDKHVSIQIETSTAEDLSNTALERDVQWLNENEFKFSGIESHTGRLFETHFVRA